MLSDQLPDSLPHRNLIRRLLPEFERGQVYRAYKSGLLGVDITRDAFLAFGARVALAQGNPPDPSLKESLDVQAGEQAKLARSVLESFEQAAFLLF